MAKQTFLTQNRTIRRSQSDSTMLKQFYDEWEDPNHDPQYGTEIKSIIVTYDNENIKAVQNAKRN